MYASPSMVCFVHNNGTVDMFVFCGAGLGVVFRIYILILKIVLINEKNKFCINIL